MDMLVRTPQPQPTESLLGYVLRLSEANGYETPVRMLASTKVASGNGHAQDICIEKLAPLVGCDPARLLPLANKLEGSDRLYFLGQSIGSKSGRNALRLAKPGFCPHCVSEVGHIDAFWDLEFAAACPRHHCTVINSCHLCGMPLTYHRPGILTCNCGANLANAPTTKVSEKISSLMEVLFTKAKGASLLSLKNEMNFPIKYLESLSIEDFFDAFMLLGRLALYKPITMSSDNHLLNATIVSDTFADWPSGFHSLLRHIDAKFSSSHHRGDKAIPRFKHFYAPMFSFQNRSKRFRFLHDEFARFNLLVLTKAEKPSALEIIINERPNWVSKKYLVLRWGISRTALDELLDQGALPVKTQKRCGSLEYQIDISKFEPLESPDAQLLPRKDASLHCGIPSAVLTQLRQRGIYKNTSPVMTIGSFSIRDLDILCLSLIRKANLIEVNVLRADATVRMCEVLSNANPANAGRKADFIASYLTGKIPALGRIGNTAGEILFSRSALRGFGCVPRIKRNSSKGAFAKLP